MAKKSKKQTAKTVARTTGKVAVAGYAWRLQITGGAAKRKAQKDAVRSDAKKVGKVAVKAANSKQGRKVRATKGGAAIERGSKSAIARTQKIAGKGPADLARNVKKSASGVVRRKTKVEKGATIKNLSPDGAMVGESPRVRGGRKKHTMWNSETGRQEPMIWTGETHTPKGKWDKMHPKVPNKAAMARNRTRAGYQAQKYGLTNHPGFGGTVAQSRTHQLGVGTAKAVMHVSNNKGKYAIGAVGAVAVGGAATYAYKRRKAAKAASGTVTYKRRIKSGKVITVTRRKGKR